MPVSVAGPLARRRLLVNRLAESNFGVQIKSVELFRRHGLEKNETDNFVLPSWVTALTAVAAGGERFPQDDSGNFFSGGIMVHQNMTMTITFSIDSFG